MPKVRVAGFSVSLDGFSAGVNQSLSDPLGEGGPELFEWFFPTKTWCEMQGKEGGSTNLDDVFARQAMAGFGAFILGRNMFGPLRGAWEDTSWKGWWGDNPPITHRLSFSRGIRVSRWSWRAGLRSIS